MNFINKTEVIAVKTIEITPTIFEVLSSWRR